MKEEAIFSLTILGSSSALPTSNRFPPAHLLNVNGRVFLIDCGEGTQIQLRKYKFRFGKLNHIFLSHIHGDHVFGLFGLLSSFQLLGRTNDLNIYGPGQLTEIIDFYKKYFGHDLNFNIVIHQLGHKRKKLIFKDDWVEVFSIPLKHRVPACGFLFRELPQDLNLKKEVIDKYNLNLESIVKIKKGEDLLMTDNTIIPNSELTLPPWKVRSYAYISDTAFHAPIAVSIDSPDLLFHEATFSEADKELASITGHSTSVQAAEIAKLGDAKKLIIGHFSSRYKSIDSLVNEAREVFPETHAANDGDVFFINRERIKNP